MITADTGLGIDYSKLWSDVKTAAGDLPGELYTQVKKTVEGKVTEAVTPTVQAQVEAKAQRVISKGNIALMAAIGATAGLLIAGGILAAPDGRRQRGRHPGRPGRPESWPGRRHAVVSRHGHAGELLR